MGSPADLEKMISSIRYRGPDDVGIEHCGTVGLAHARLSILDVSSAGHQPMWNVDKTVAIVFNGEIYNFAELRKELVAKGRRFQSTTDTEVILALYDEVGEKCFERLNGMFAIALYDFKKEKLILARDRIGKKPLYYGVFKNTLIFGSEAKVFLHHPSFIKKLNLAAFSNFLSREYVPTPECIFEGVQKLPPATYLVFEKGVVRTEKFWTPDFSERKVSLGDALGEFEKILSDSVAARLVADVPVGVFLSGGLDSSAVAYYATQRSAKKVQTFSIGFSEKSFDESGDAALVAKTLGTEHHKKIVSARDMREAIPRIFSRLDEPLADASIIPTFLLSEFTRGKVTVALGGDGGDELFAGYPTFQAEKLVALYKKIPRALREKIIAPLVAHLPPSHRYMSFDFKAKRFLVGADEKSAARRHARWLGAFDREAQKKLLAPEIFHAIQNEKECAGEETALAEFVSAGDPQNALLFSYLRTYLMDEVMVKVDRASMFNSLETRSPLLDYHAVEFAFRLPYDFKLRGRTTKFFLKKLMEGKLPSRIIHKKKQGFAVPLGRWLREDLRPLMLDVLSEENIKKTGLFDFACVSRLVREHLSGTRDNRKELWTLISFMLWYDSFLRN